MFVIHQPRRPVVLGETGKHFLPMLMDAPVQIVGHPNISRAILLAGHDVDVVDWRHGQAMDSRVRGNDKIVGCNGI